jgi:hypothetical protein
VRAAIFAAVLLVACSSPSPAASGPTPSAGPGATRYGVAGLIARHFPKPAAADYETLYSSLAGTGGTLGLYTAWSDAGAEGAPPAAIAAAAAAAAKYRFGPLVIALGVTEDAPGGVRSTVDWNGPQRDRFIAAATAVAKEHKPELLALGVESNRLWMSDPAAFDGFVSGYAQAYDAIKKVSPATRVFTIFQLELMRGGAFLITGKESSPAQWELLAKFDRRLDVAGFTTYPFLAYRAPADIPVDYYADAARRAGVPVAFTEIGWPSADLGGAATGSAYGGTPEEQAAFASRFFALTKGLDVAAALWSFPNDLGAAGPRTFSSVGLRDNDGSAKPALAVWRSGVATK